MRPRKRRRIGGEKEEIDEAIEKRREKRERREREERERDHNTKTRPEVRESSCNYRCNSSNSYEEGIA